MLRLSSFVIKTLTYVGCFAVLSSCVFAPGMDMRKSLRKGDGLVYAKTDGLAQDVPIIPINEDLIAQLKPEQAPENIPPELLLPTIDDGYRIGVNDVLSVVVWGQPELLSTGALGNNPLILRQVRDDGTFFFPYAGTIDAEGLTREQVRLNLTRELDRYFQNPQVDVAIEQYNSQRVVVSGQFNRPVTLPVTAVPLTLSQAISEAAGPNEQADLTDLQLNRSNRLYSLNYHELANNGQIHNIVLRDGDVIHLPVNQSNSAFIVGEVGRAQPITLTTGRITLTDALATAQGLSPRTSSGNEVYVVRGVDSIAGEKAIYKLDAKSPVAFLLASQFEIRSQDVIFVGPAELAKWNRVISQVFPFASLLNAIDQVGSER